MTDERRGGSGDVGPPWSVDVLADLHAGALDDAEAARLWPRVEADPEARAVLEALEATRADLAELGAAPAPPMPARVAGRIDAALAEESRRRAGESRGGEPGIAPVVSLDATRRRRRRLMGLGGGLLTAAAAAVAAVAILVPGAGNGGPDNGNLPGAAPGPDTDEPPVSLRRDNLNTAIGEINEVRDFGPLGTEERLDACLAANGIDPDVKPAGIRPATIDGDPAVVVLLTTGQFAQFRLVALAPDCGPDNPGLLLDETVGRQGG
ncbi:hypothetical protein SAMN05421810_103621 [Amycolatopsis arida]|uniref:Anti-sigma-M factor RsmA n=1 Tax=Amycolatopsis arida TaxID=587909 RepID=A0A1I5TR05_9PSEU|nr:hypothetical protein [Amycolatopsis arida]TDX96001.1 hypothetical protein CLV69_103136 [Amycolatopsis arida]SFP85489.1 hypothetical protein SAMN05421810_103621 [Amycolatopsis arida]